MPRRQQHEVIAKLLEQMATTSDEQLRPQLQVYEIQHESPDILLQQLRLVVPDRNADIGSDDQPLDRLCLSAPAAAAAGDVAEVWKPTTPNELPNVPVVYSLREVQPETVLTMMQAMFPRAKASARCRLETPGRPGQFAAANGDRAVHSATRIAAIRTSPDQRLSLNESGGRPGSAGRAVDGARSQVDVRA